MRENYITAADLHKVPKVSSQRETLEYVVLPGAPQSHRRFNHGLLIHERRDVIQLCRTWLH